MASMLSHIIRDEHFILSSERVIFWENEKTLIAADLHVGKSGHFRKSGIAIPQSVYKDDLQRLLAQLLFFKAERLIIVGDLTHSQANLELDLFRRWRLDFPSLDVHLTKGNHDILDESWYGDAKITVHREPFHIRNFTFVHDRADRADCDYCFSGHVHPALVLRGRGKQALRFPCFYFGKKDAILPAFSRFTGTYTVRPDPGEQAYAIVEKDIVLFESNKKS